MAVTAAMLINGQAAGLERDAIAVRDPATLDALGTIAAGTAEDVARAVRAAGPRD